LDRWTILGLETSCDETAAAVVQGAPPGPGKILSNIVFSQNEAHAPYGGVVPEIASRAHLEILDGLIEQALAEAGITLDEVDAIAATAGPGLIGGVMVGLTTAKALALATGKPLLAVNHLAGHALTARLTHGVNFPFLLLLISGGHCQLLAVESAAEFRLYGSTMDDAVGEAFDKTAKLMGLPYPGGPALAKLAEQGRAGAFRFSRPMTDRPGLDFSFSGLKTQVLLAWQASDRSDQTRADIARAFEEAIVDTLIIKCRRALQASGAQRLVIAGGVGANRRLRSELALAAAKDGFKVYFPRLDFCTDNGAMIALAGAIRLASGQHQDESVQVYPRWDLQSLPAA
jgi:N6-L-threonylcarbamoyladenine synthase